MFLGAFLAGSLLPFPSEVVLVALLKGGASAAETVLVATAGNVLGAVTLYGMGWAFERGLLRGRLRRRLEDDPEALARARERFARWGTWGLLAAWVPLVGDAFVLGAGLASVRFLPFLALVTLGKAGRYAVVAWTAG